MLWVQWRWGRTRNVELLFASRGLDPNHLEQSRHPVKWRPRVHSSFTTGKGIVRGAQRNPNATDGFETLNARKVSLERTGGLDQKVHFDGNYSWSRFCPVRTWIHPVMEFPRDAAVTSCDRIYFRLSKHFPPAPVPLSRRPKLYEGSLSLLPLLR